MERERKKKRAKEREKNEGRLTQARFLREIRATNQNLFCSKNMQRVPGMGERNA